MSNAFEQKLQSTKTTKATKSKKKEMPVVNFPKLTEIMKAFIDAQAREKTAKADKSFAANELKEHARKEQDKRAFNGEFAKSYNLRGTGDIAVKYVSVDKFSIILEDDIETLQSLLGEKFDSLIKEDMLVTLKSNVFTNDAKQEKLMELVGDHWDDFFDTTSVFNTKTDFDSNIYNSVKNQKALNQVRSLIKQTSPSIR